MYLEALREGKEKIPYCSMLILGDERVGKTSLYRQLVGKDFKEDWCQTRGIDNNTVDTVDRRALDIESDEWKEKMSSEEDGGFVKALSKEVVKNLPPPPPEVKDDGGIKEVSAKDLMHKIEEAIDTIKKRIKERERIKSALIVSSSSAGPNGGAAVPVILSPTLNRKVPVLQKKKKESGDNVEARPEKKSSPLQEPRPKPKTLPGSPPPDAPPPDTTPSDATPLDTTPSKVTPSKVTPLNAMPDAAEKKQEHADMLNRRQSSYLDIAVKKRVVDNKNPPLVLNTLDFAGQKLYRPMHHCFISRRALYIVVFKIPDMQKKASRKKSLEDLRYWIHSIHSHIYPPEEDMKGEDKKINRVFLVGTHRGDHTDEDDGDLKEIDDLIKKELIADKRCCNHIRSVKALSCRTNYFIPVENEIDHTHENYLHISGTRDVQIVVKTTSKKLPFLKEYYPIKWLKFEERLKKQMETLSTTPVMTVEGVKALAVKSNITSEDQRDLALKFFHDTGKIICISELQCTWDIKWYNYYQ